MQLFDCRACAELEEIVAVQRIEIKKALAASQAQKQRGFCRSPIPSTSTHDVVQLVGSSITPRGKGLQEISHKQGGYIVCNQLVTEG
jgi:hypothetical protein